MRSGTSK